MTIILVARTIGARTATASLSGEQHAALIFDLGETSAPDYWIVQGGPRRGLLLGALGHLGRSWQQAFGEVSGGMIWDQSTVGMSVNLTEISRFSIPAVTRSRLQTIVDTLNRRRERYEYASGPNSNTYVRGVLQTLGLHYNPTGVVLRGW